MSRVNQPYTAEEYKALRSLLDIFDDIHALDAAGNDILAYVNKVHDWPIEYGQQDRPWYGSYRQDLWYCALKRSKLDIRYNVQPCRRLAQYTRWYTPKHYLALCHLDHWNSFDEELFETQIQPVLQEHPLSEDEIRIQEEFESLWELENESDSSPEERIEQETETQSEWESDSDFSSERDGGSM
jgi:hypothetical protein